MAAPRLARFREAHPAISRDLSTGLPPTDLERDNVDMVVQWGDMLLRDVVADDWEAWFARAAEAGLGVDLGYRTLIAPDVQAGRLVELFGIE